MNSMQDEFDAVVKHLYTQKRPAKPMGEAGCYYRTKVGETVLSCAVGCRIPDAIYDINMDQAGDAHGTDVDSLIRRFEKVLPAEIVAYNHFFSDLQSVHDHAYVEPSTGEFDLALLKVNLKDTANRFGLVLNIPEQ